MSALSSESYVTFSAPMLKGGGLELRLILFYFLALPVLLLLQFPPLGWWLALALVVAFYLPTLFPLLLFDQGSG